MKIGVQTARLVPIGLCPDRAAIEAGFARIRRAGFDSVDFNINQCLTYGAITKGDTGGVFDMDADALRAHFAPYKEAAQAAGISISQMHAPYPSCTENEMTNEYVLMAFEKSIAICEYLDCPHLVIHPVLFPYEQQLTKAGEWGKNLQIYTHLIPFAKKHHVTVCLENMIVFKERHVYEASCANMYEAVALVDELNRIAGEECFGFCLDTGHALLLGTDLYQAVMQLGSRLKVLHIHDNNGQMDQHIMPYMGILDWPRFLRGLKDAGYRGVISFEAFNVFNLFGEDLTDECLALMAAVGKRFAREVAG